ncbi:MAG: prepilin-type N-terminal cleavage/methylation domain-containing protein [Candidatus Cloacimonetes bacterium]|nr:prepilin-type N-terminal cleavage/methylation domain-containing protein [Candidatus Cloacimonadota bacterium]
MKLNSLKQKGKYTGVTAQDVSVPLCTPDGAVQSRKASQFLGLLRNQRGYTLIEAMVLTVVLAAMVATIYTGVIYADKQTRLNYRHRVATFIASGEIEKQYTIFMKTGRFMPFTGKEVFIDDITDDVVKGSVTVSVKEDVEYNVSKIYPYFYLIVDVVWVDPISKKRNKVTLREDFYDVEGKVNP